MTGDTKTLQLFKDLRADRLAAIGADVDAAGGEKVVGSKLYPKLSPDTAARKVANCLNPKQAHGFDDEEVWTIKQMARTASGRSRLHEFESGELHADISWVSDEQFIERKETLIESKLDDLSRELQELKEARRAAAARGHVR